MLPRRVPRLVLPLTTVALVVGVAAPAYAAPTIYNNGNGNWAYDGDGATNIVQVTCVATNIFPTPTVGDPMPCTSIKLVSVNPLGGEDTVDLSGVTTEQFPNVLATSVNVAPDMTSDSVTGSPYSDVVIAGAGDSVTTVGGNDHITGGVTVNAGDGDDVLEESDGGLGGNGNDRFVQAASVGSLADGGAGDDTMELDFNKDYLNADLDFVLDSQKLRVEVPGDFVDIPMTNFEHMVLELGNAGAQSLDASAFPGDLIVRGFGGSDVITGTTKSDYLNGGYGNDTIEARDGVADTVLCGPGTDIARVDGFDSVAGCESITYAKPQTSAIKGPGQLKRSRTGSFTFSSNVPGSAFQCKIDKQKWKSCSSPFKVAGSSLALGSHTLRVRAGYPAGNWDATPSKKSFSVVR